MLTEINVIYLEAFAFVDYLPICAEYISFYISKN